MGILVNTGFKVGSAEPLNEYSVRETLADRNALVTDGYVYEGMEVYCKDTKVKYRWNGAAWDEIGSGGTSAAGNIATYSLPSQLGLDDDVFSVSDIINAMKALDKAAMGMFTIRGNADTGESAPTFYGVLMVEAIGQDVSVRYVGTNADGDTYGDWFGYVEYADDGTVSNIDWKNTLHEVEDISYEAPHDVNINNVKKALDDLYDLAYYTALEITSFTATPAGGVFETGTTVSAPTFNWTFNNTVTNQELTDCTLATTETRSASYGSDISSDKTFTLEAEDKRASVASKSISYKFVNPYYVGESATNILDDTSVTALTKKIVVKGTQTVSYTTSQSYMVFAYPSSYGTIKKVIDQNGFNVTNSFVQSTVIIGTEQYYVYVSNQCTGSYNMTFSY